MILKSRDVFFSGGPHSRGAENKRVCLGLDFGPTGVGPSRGKNNQGFSLIEVILAMLILGIGMASITAMASRCLAIARKARNFETARLLLGKIDLESPIDYENFGAGSESGRFEDNDGFSWKRTIEQIGEEDDGIYKMRIEIFWSDRNKEVSEEVETYLHVPEELTGGVIESVAPPAAGAAVPPSGAN